MALSTLISGTLTVPYIHMTIPVLNCPPPVLQQDFDGCRVPGGVELWEGGGFYSPGVCFAGYRAMCTQTSPRWPVAAGETAVRCIPTGYDCDDEDSMFATSVYDGTTLSAPAFEIRWRTEDLELMPPFTDVPTAMGNPTTFATSVTPAPGDRRGSSTSSLLSSPPGQDEDDEDTPAESGSLSTGSVAGIAIGASVGVLGMSMTALFILSRRRRRQDAEEARRQSEATPTVSSSGLAAAFQRPPVELEDQRSGPTELAADSSTIYRGRLDEEQRDDPVHPEPSIFTAGSAQRNRNV